MSATGLRILLVGPYPLQEGKIVGGVEAVTRALAPALAAEERIAQVLMLCFHAGHTSLQRICVNDKLHIWHMRGQKRFRLLTRTLWQTWQTSRIAAEFQPDLVHGQGIGSYGDIATQLRRPSAVTIHGLIHLEAQMHQRGSIKRVIRNHLMDSRVHRVLRRAKTIISISNYDAQALAGLVQGHHVIIPNPVSPEFFQAPYQETPQPSVLFAGVLVRRKNIEGLLRAFALARQAVPDARLTLVGPAPDPVYASRIHEQARASGLADAVTFAGHVENERLLREIGACSVVTLFSHEETSPTILAQAMAMRKPVVTSRVGGVPEMIRDGETGFLVSPGDERAFAEQLTVLLRSPELRRTMGMRGYEIARQRYEPAAIARRTVDVYQRTLHGNACGS
jgi:glycosyltransferase involved in cell wall biosynthesis